MPVTIKVNGVANSMVHKGSGGITVATIPDVCLTPSPAGPVPVPYPNIAMSSALTKGTTSVKADGGMMIAVKGSELAMSTGDEAGSNGGVASGTFKGPSSPILFSFDVKIDGRNAVRLTDKMLQNRQNTADLAGLIQAPVVVVAAAPVAAAPVREFEAEVLEVEWLDGIAIARDKVTVVPPHWTPGVAVHEEDLPAQERYPGGSRKPGLYTVASGTKPRLRVKVNVTRSANQPGQGTLRGQLGGFAFSGPCTTGVGEQDVEVESSEAPDSARHYTGDVQWTLSADREHYPLHNTTRLEVFAILDTPAGYFVDGVWVEALRFLFRKAGVALLREPKDVAVCVTRYCHTRHGMRYDTALHNGGRSHFGASGKEARMFQLMDYMARNGDSGNLVNCFDQAAAVESLCGTMGVDVDWVFRRPYGYIKPTSLVGVGLCNNPFFDPNHPRKLVAWDTPYPQRKPFGCHAFNDLDGRVFDACAGPHLGTETLREYLEAAVDAKRSSDGPEDDYWDDLANQTHSCTGVLGVV